MRNFLKIVFQKLIHRTSQSLSAIFKVSIHLGLKHDTQWLIGTFFNIKAGCRNDYSLQTTLLETTFFFFRSAVCFSN